MPRDKVRIIGLALAAVVSVLRVLYPTAGLPFCR